MRLHFLRSLAAAPFAALFWLSGEAARAEVPVDLELVLAVDVSGSMDDDEHVLQRQGYVEAFRHPLVIGAITSGILGRIAVTYVEWAGPASQVVTVAWRIIDGGDSARAFANALSDAPIAYIRGTSISGGLAYAATLFAGNGIEGTRRVIDISGDGANNMGKPVEAARARASIVLPTPGTSSISRWPRASIAIRASRVSSVLPMITRSTFARIRSDTIFGSSTLPPPDKT